MEPTAAEQRRGCLEKLSLELGIRGFEVDLGQSRTGVPLLAVANPARPEVAGRHIACVIGLDGDARFAWPQGSSLAAVDDLPAAVTEVTRLLGAGDG